MPHIRSLAMLFVLALLSLPAYAADDSKDALPVPPPSDPAKMEELGKVNPYLPKLDKKAREIGENLKPQELAHLYHVREGFGVLRAVTIVRRDIGAAVKACGKANPALKEKMDGRYAAWTGAVDPAVKSKEAEIDAAIAAQTYAPAKDIRDYMKLIEQTADYANRNLDKDIITTPEACESLRQSMDDTQSVVAKTVGQIEIQPWPPTPESEAPVVKTPN